MKRGKHGQARKSPPKRSLRYRIHLESRQLAPGTINGRLAAVRRLAYEAADSGLLAAGLAAGIQRVKGPKNLGVRLGNWLAADQAIALWEVPDPDILKGKRDRALLGVLLVAGCVGKRQQNWTLLTATAGRSLGHRRFGRQGSPYPDGARTGLGEERHRFLASVRRGE